MPRRNPCVKRQVGYANPQKTRLDMETVAVDMLTRNSARNKPVQVFAGCRSSLSVLPGKTVGIDSRRTRSLECFMRPVLPQHT